MKIDDVWHIALQKAQEAFDQNEVPVGAVIVKNGSVIAAASNRCERAKDPTQHAELVAIQEALRLTGDMYLSDCTLYVTLEPCCMCAGAIDLVGIRKVYFGAYDPKMGEIDHNHKVWDGKKIEVYGGFFEKEYSNLLKRFFKKLR